MRPTIFAAIILLSCNQAGNIEQNTKTTSVAIDTTSASPGSAPSSNTAGNSSVCFMQVLKRDTFVAVIARSNNIISGKLTFDNFEKDGSSGSITGREEKGILKLWYSFQSEGMQSVMQVFLKDEDDKLIRGTGEMSSKGDSSFFVNPAAVSYDNNLIMQKINCDKVPQKYR